MCSHRCARPGCAPSKRAPARTVSAMAVSVPGWRWWTTRRPRWTEPSGTMRRVARRRSRSASAAPAPSARRRAEQKVERAIDVGGADRAVRRAGAEQARTLSTLCRRRPASASTAAPRSSRSTTTSTSSTTRPASRNGATASSLAPPLVTTSSIIRARSPAANSPSIRRLVPYVLGLLARVDHRPRADQRHGDGDRQPGVRQPGEAVVAQARRRAAAWRARPGVSASGCDTSTRRSR